VPRLLDYVDPKAVKGLKFDPEVQGVLEQDMGAVPEDQLRAAASQITPILPKLARIHTARQAFPDAKTKTEALSRLDAWERDYNPVQRVTKQFVEGMGAGLPSVNEKPLAFSVGPVRFNADVPETPNVPTSIGERIARTVGGVVPFVSGTNIAAGAIREGAAMAGAKLGGKAAAAFGGGVVAALAPGTGQERAARGLTTTVMMPLSEMTGEGAANFIGKAYKGAGPAYQEGARAAASGAAFGVGQTAGEAALEGRPMNRDQVAQGGLEMAALSLLMHGPAMGEAARPAAAPAEAVRTESRAMVPTGQTTRTVTDETGFRVRRDTQGSTWNIPQEMQKGLPAPGESAIPVNEQGVADVGVPPGGESTGLPIFGGRSPERAFVTLRDYYTAKGDAPEVAREKARTETAAGLRLHENLVEPSGTTTEQRAASVQASTALRRTIEPLAREQKPLQFQTVTGEAVQGVPIPSMTRVFVGDPEPLRMAVYDPASGKVYPVRLKGVGELQKIVAQRAQVDRAELAAGRAQESVQPQVKGVSRSSRRRGQPNQTTTNGAGKAPLPEEVVPPPAPRQLRIEDQPPEAVAPSEEVVPTPAASGTEAPAVSGLPDLSKNNYRRSLHEFGPRAYREVGFSGLEELVGNVHTDLRGDVYLANHPDLALGQGGNKGFLVEFDTKNPELQGQANTSKPAWRMLYDQGQAEMVGRHNPTELYRDAVRSVTVKPGLKLRESERARLERAVKGWAREALPDGSVRYTRPGEPASEPAPPQELPNAAPAAGAASVPAPAPAPPSAPENEAGRRGYQTGEYVSAPYAGRGSYFGRKTERTNEPAKVEGYVTRNGERLVHVTVKRGKTYEQHFYREDQLRRYPDPERAKADRRKAAEAKVAKETAGSTVDDAQKLLAEAREAHRAADERAREIYPQAGEDPTREYLNLRAKMRKVSDRIDALKKAIKAQGGKPAPEPVQEYPGGGGGGEVFITPKGSVGGGEAGFARAGMFGVPEAKRAAPEPEPTPEELATPRGAVMHALKGAEPLREGQEAARSAQRTERLGKYQSALKGAKTEAEIEAAGGHLSGQYVTHDFTPLRDRLSQDQIDGIRREVAEHPALDGFDKKNAQDAIKKVIDGKLPTESESELLERVFGKEFTAALEEKKKPPHPLRALINEVVGVRRTLKTMWDVSGSFRQNAIVTGKPGIFWPNFRQQLKALGSEEAYRASEAEIRSRRTYGLMKRAGVPFTDAHGKPTAQEEAFFGSGVAASKIPGAEASNRAYATISNRNRADIFDDLVRRAQELGRDPYTEKKIAKDMASWAGTATGRATDGWLAKHAETANYALWSPRLIQSRLNLLNPLYYKSLDPVVRKEALKTMFSFAAQASTALALSAMAGAQVSSDPDSADFGKIRIGNTRYEIFGGLTPYARAAIKSLRAMHAITQGEEADPTKPILELFKGKLGPEITGVISQFRGKEFPYGKKFESNTPEGGAGELVRNVLTGEGEDRLSYTIRDFMPLALSDFGRAYSEWGPMGLPLAAPTELGVGVQTYEDGGD